MTKEKKILIIYTGGTVGMRLNEEGVLVPLDFASLKAELPELQKLPCEIDFFSFAKPIDSATMQPEHWVQMAEIIEDNYFEYDGFVILHGSDTLSFTASALSFMLENLSKPVILTGAQLSLNMIRSDARENIITAIEIACNTQKCLNEVCIYFGDKLYRGNRTTKFNAESYNAFISPNYPSLVDVGVNITYHTKFWLKPSENLVFSTQKHLNKNIALLKFYPGMSPEIAKAIFHLNNLEAIVLESFGIGNLPIEDWLFELIKEANEKGIFIINISQCKIGKVVQGKYETSKNLGDLGVISGEDLTTESALTKLMYLLGKFEDKRKIKHLIGKSLRGEMFIS